MGPSKETRSILHIEDDEDDAYIVRRGLRHLPFDYHLEVFSDAAVALVYLKKCQSEDKLPDLILLDLHMPGMDGFDFLEAVRKDDDLSEIRVVVLTGMDDDESLLKSYESGATSYLTKPQNKFEFQSFIANATEWWADTSL
jgi:two-component system, response regulator